MHGKNFPSISKTFKSLYDSRTADANDRTSVE